MTTITRPRKYVDPPAFTPRPSGLLSVAQVVTDPDPHWRNGVEWGAVCGDGTESLVTSCQPGEVGVRKSATAGGLEVRGADPFSLYAWLPVPVRCADADFAELRRRTERALTNNEAAAIEAIFWSGVTSDGGVVHPHLASDKQVVEDGVVVQTKAEVLADDPVEPAVALGLLEEALAGCAGGAGVIHAPLRAVGALAWDRLITVTGGRAFTGLGTAISWGAGYDGSGPDGTNPGPEVAWLYGTGPVRVWRTPVEWTSTSPAEFVDKRINSTVLVAERSYVVAWDCCHFAVPVQLVCPTGGGGGADSPIGEVVRLASP